MYFFFGKICTSKHIKERRNWSRLKKSLIGNQNTFYLLIWSLEINFFIIQASVYITYGNIISKALKVRNSVAQSITGHSSFPSSVPSWGSQESRTEPEDYKNKTVEVIRNKIKIQSSPNFPPNTLNVFL